jgi:NAD/NADP transhydrogenase alpha subunit
MTNLNGYRATLEAFMSLPRFSKLVVSAAGKIEPAKVFVIGAGVAGLSVLGVAKNLGAIVRAFDSREVVKE